MALNANWNELATTTLNLWASKNFANLFTSQKPLWYKLRKKQNIITGGLGIKILEPFLYPTTAGPQLEGVADPYTEMVPSKTVGWTNAEYAWCEKRLSVSEEELVLDQQGSDTAKMNHLQAVKDISMKKFFEGLNADMWRAESAVGSNGSSRQYLGSVRTYFNRGGSNTTDGGAIPPGLTEQTGTATGTTPLTLVGNVERNAVGAAYWCTPLFTTTVTTITLGKMNNVISLAVCDPDSPDLFVTTRANFDSIMEILQGYQRYSDSALADAGFEAVRYRGCDVVFDQNCPATTAFALNTDYIKLRAASMAPGFVEKPDPNRTIVNWNARWVGQITSGNLGRFHSRATAWGA
jgi:hypothetical protein